MVLPKLLDGFLPVGGLRYQLHVWLGIDQSRDPFAQEGVIINGEDSNHTRTGAHESSVYGTD